MNERQLQRLVQLSRKTGDPLIVLDEQGDGSVILPLSRYEELVQTSSGSSAPKKAKEEVVPTEVPRPEIAPIPEAQEQISTPPPPEDTEIETQFYLEPVE